jgi:hypothetical protein
MNSKTAIIGACIGVALLLGALVSAYYFPTDLSRLLTALQLVGAVVALLVAARTLLTPKVEREGTERISETSAHVAKFNGIKSELEDLTKAISEVCGGIGEDALKAYEQKFLSGQRTVYIKFLTAGSGVVLRKKFLGKSASDQFARRMGTYNTSVRKAFKLGDGPVTLPDDLAITGLGRVFLAVNAALAPDEKTAQLYIRQLQDLEGGQAA